MEIDNTQFEKYSNLIVKPLKITKIIVYFRDSDGVEGYKREKEIDMDNMSEVDKELIVKTINLF